MPPSRASPSRRAPPGDAFGRRGRAFRLPSGSRSELFALKHWSIKTRDAALLSDLSDLAVDPQNRLLLLGDQGRAIAERDSLYEIEALP